MVVRVQPPGWVAPASHAPASHAPASHAPAGDDDDEEEPHELTVSPDDLLAVWKPTAGERPLADFPLGTLTRREVAAFEVSEALGWRIVPPTVLREGPYGEGMLQAWIHPDPAADVVALIMASDPRLRRVAVFDAIVNNTDRKGGHLLPVGDGHVHGVDHGVTFSDRPKLRTVLWGWRGTALEPDELDGLARVRAALDGDLAVRLRGLLAAREIDATRRRVEALLTGGVFPEPRADWPAVPFPPF